MSIADLIAKLEAAGEGSRELDALIVAAVDYRPAWLDRDEGQLWADMRGAPTVRWQDARMKRGPGNPSAYDLPPEVTTSLDALVGLVGRKLPGWTLAQLSQQDDKTWFAELREGFLTSYDRVASSSVREGCRPKTAPLALCIAFLKATEAST